MYKFVIAVIALSLWTTGCSNSQVKQDLTTNKVAETKTEKHVDAKENKNLSEDKNLKVDSAPNGHSTTDLSTNNSSLDSSTDVKWETTDTSALNNTIAENSTTTTSNMSTSVTNTVATSGSGIVLVLSTNDFVEGEDREVFLKAVIDKWLKGKEYQEVDTKTFDNTMEQYDGRTVLTVKISRSYGEFEISARAGKIVKDEQGPYEDPLGKTWSARGALAAEDLVKEIKFAKNVFEK